MKNNNKTINKINKQFFRISDFLDSCGCIYDVYFLKNPINTSQDIEKNKEVSYTKRQWLKSIVLICKKNDVSNFILTILPTDRKIDMNRLKELSNADAISIASKDEVERVLSGIKVGGVPPFGRLFDVDVYADSLILNLDKIVFSCGDSSVCVSMDTKDFIKIEQPIIAHITDTSSNF